MKKRFFTLILTLTAMLLCIFGLTACGDKEISFKLNFVVDETVYATIDTSGDKVIALPENPSPCVVIRQTFKIPRLQKKYPMQRKYFAEASNTAVALDFTKIRDNVLPAKIKIIPAISP